MKSSTVIFAMLCFEIKAFGSKSANNGKIAAFICKKSLIEVVYQFDVPVLR